MKSFRVLTPANAMNLGRRIGTTLRSVPLPHIDTRLAAQAMQRAGRSIGRAAGRLADAVAPAQMNVEPDPMASPAERLQAFRAFAQLGMQAGQADNLHPANRIPSAKQLADNLKDADEPALANLGGSLERLMTLCERLDRTLDGMDDAGGMSIQQAVGLGQDLAAITHLADRIQCDNEDHPGGYSTHLELWMTQLSETGKRLRTQVARLPVLQFRQDDTEVLYDRLNSPNDVQKKTITRVASKAALGGQHKVAARYKQPAPEPINPESSGTTSSESSADVSEVADIDFGGIYDFVGAGDDAFIQSFLPTLSSKLGAVVEHEAQAAREVPGSTDWCRAVIEATQAMASILRILDGCLDHYEQHNGQQPGLSKWFETQSRAMAGRVDLWAEAAQPYAAEFKKQGFVFR